MSSILRRLTVAICLLLLLEAAVCDNVEDNEIDTDGERHPHSKYPASNLPGEVDILQLLNVSAKDQGVSLVKGPIRNYPAYKFRLPYGNVPIANGSAITNLINENTNGFTAIFVYRQQKNNLGTFISINSPGRLTPWFQIASNSKTGVITMKYRVNSRNQVKQFDWPLPKHHKKAAAAGWTWFSVSVSDVIRVDMDCMPSKFEVLFANKKSKIATIPSDALVYFRQEPGRKKKFLGSLQVAKIVPYVMGDRFWSCMQISENLPAQMRKPLT